MKFALLFNRIVFQAVGMTPGGSSSISLIQNKIRHIDRFWVLPGEKIQTEGMSIAQPFLNGYFAYILVWMNCIIFL